ncbi:unnamed protein product [Dicrocoelium dendriticum]|nr:unnamed protein product [Dicrocoelium dendriticum]
MAVRVVKTSIDLLEQSQSRYVCTLCPHYTDRSYSDANLELHCRLHHSGFSRITCIYCSRSISVTSIIKHIDKHFVLSDQPPYPCPLCPFAYNTSKSLAQHAVIVHHIAPSTVFYKCGHCDMPFNDHLDLSSHLASSCISLYHCQYPKCFVKSTCSDLVADHYFRRHGSSSVCFTVTRQYICSDYSSASFTGKSSISTPVNSTCARYSLFCSRCAFGTLNLDTFAKHLVSCRPLLHGDLSVTCTLHHCLRCGWTSTVKTMLLEHVHEAHPDANDDCIQSEDFTVPVSEDTVSDPSTITMNTPASHLAHPISAGSIDVLSAVTSSFKELSSLFSTANISSLISNAALNPQLDAIQSKWMFRPDFGLNTQLKESMSVDSRATDQDGIGNEREMFPESNAYQQGIEIAAPSPEFSRDQMDRLVSPTLETRGNEFVQLYFNEPAFVFAYTKNGRFTGPHKATHSTELSGVLQRLRKFASYKVPILGRANQRRVAGCPECSKQFNHGFTDLKKHLLVTHLNLRRDITRFALEFTHPVHNPVASCSTGWKQNLFSLRATRNSMKTFRKRTSVQSSHNYTLGKRRTTFQHDSCKPSASPVTSSPSGLPVLVNANVPAYSGSAPVHRVIPGTGISDQYEDLRTLEEVAAEAPTGRGGVIHLDDEGNAIAAALDAARASQQTLSPTNSQMFLPKLGRQHVQLAYSYAVFKRLLEAYQVPMAERTQLVNRMNHYARMYVIMDVLVPGGAQKRFSCPICMYTSVHSLADIRKHIMGSHCGISTKRFRLCLRASRHDTTTYRLHTDERMIRFVDDHRRRQLQMAGKQVADSSVSVDSDCELRTTSKCSIPNGQFCESTQLANPHSHAQSQEDPGTRAIELETQIDRDIDRTHETLQICNIRSLSCNQTPSPDTASGTSPYDCATVIANNILNAHSDETLYRNEEFRRRIDLPFSANVLRTLLEREGMEDQLDDLLKRMQVYSSHHLTVISRGNRIHAYICVCGRRFAVIRDDLDNDNRPASLADCRRHILGVHARVPQELLTLCCQASRISKESGYKLYSDSSLVALAEQHKFRNSRTQGCRGSSPSCIADTSATSRRSEMSDSSASPSGSGFGLGQCGTDQIVHRQSTNDGTDSLPKSTVRKCEANEPTSTLQESANVGQESHINTSPITRKLDMPLIRSSANFRGLDLDPPHRTLTPGEANEWGKVLSLPESWTLERIVRLPYSASFFDEQLKSMLPNDNSFIKTLHDRMRYYGRHSVYIVRLCTPTNSTQRIYACCACLSTSQHGFGDVRKHILGVHAHVPERFKTLAMNSSRLNREDYSLQSELQLLQSSTTSWHSSTGSQSRWSSAASNKAPAGCSRVLRRRRQSTDLCSSPQLRSASPLPKRRPSEFEHDQDGLISATSDREKNVVVSSDPNDARATACDPSSFIEALPSQTPRPPIRLTLPRPKAFHSFHSQERTTSPLMRPPIQTGKSLGENVHSEAHRVSGGSRSRRSMILKSKRPLPTTI